MAIPKALAMMATKIKNAVSRRKPKPSSLLQKYAGRIKADDTRGLYESFVVRLVELDRTLAVIKDRQVENEAETQKIKNLLEAYALIMREQTHRLDALEPIALQLLGPAHMKEQASSRSAADRNSSN